LHAVVPVFGTPEINVFQAGLLTVLNGIFKYGGIE
jgi:hypothetical protein